MLALIILERTTKNMIRSAAMGKNTRGRKCRDHEMNVSKKVPFLGMAVLPFVSGKCQLFQGMQKNNLATANIQGNFISRQTLRFRSRALALRISTSPSHDSRADSQ